jgi:hypothetical protein
MKHISFCAFTGFTVLTACAAAFMPFNRGAYDLAWHSMDGGGGVSSGGIYALSGTIGQPDAGTTMTGGGYVLIGGFQPGLGSPEVGLPCPADFDGSNDVGVNDFFALLQNWGMCPASPAACPWDIAPGGGDGDVGVDDFFALLQNWGPCR